MDPDACLAQMRTLIAEAHETSSEFDDLRDLFAGLDAWLSGGCALPEDWKRSDRELRAQLRAAEAELADVRALFSDYRLRHETIIPLLQAGKVEEAREAARGFS